MLSQFRDCIWEKKLGVEQWSPCFLKGNSYCICKIKISLIFGNQRDSVTEDSHQKNQSRVSVKAVDLASKIAF